MSRFVRFTRGAPGVLNANGLEVLRGALWEGGQEKESTPFISGAAGRQNFRTLAHEKRGLLEPIPEGRYHQIGGLEWAGSPGDYDTVWSQALGPVVIEIYGERAIMLHLDGGVPGSAGCLCPLTLAGLKIVVRWWAKAKPDFVECDWGLGTIAVPGKPTLYRPPAIQRVKFFQNGPKITAYRNGDPTFALASRLDYHDGRVGVALNGRQLQADLVESIAFELAYRAK